MLMMFDRCGPSQTSTSRQQGNELVPAISAVFGGEQTAELYMQRYDKNPSSGTETKTRVSHRPVKAAQDGPLDLQTGEDMEFGHEQQSMPFDYLPFDVLDWDRPDFLEPYLDLEFFGNEAQTG